MDHWFSLDTVETLWATGPAGFVCQEDAAGHRGTTSVSREPYISGGQEFHYAKKKILLFFLTCKA